MRKKLFAANWKMYKNLRETGRFFAELRELLPEREREEEREDEAVVFPPSILVAEALRSCGAGVKIGVQNIHWLEEGPYTGEISARQAADIGAAYCLCGHSERRRHFHETDEMVAAKARAALQAGLGPVVCVGETLEQRQNGETMTVLAAQTRAALAGLPAGPQIIVAYEPVWAIGTGVTATGSDAQDACSFIRRELAGLWPLLAAETRILYGGSVSPRNIRELMSCPDIDGVLVGAASLEAQSFADIINFRR
ncbi:MAG: triose-phosphate isomerase [Clostridiales bacterium]|nr:triose-phosphate isomerase [Clostridiales bacterium]